MTLPGTPESRRFAAMVGVFVAAGVAVTWLLLPPAPIDPRKEAVPIIHVAGVPLPAEGDAVANALDLVRRYAAGEIAIVLPDKSERKVKRGALGAEIDRVRLAEFVREARRPGSAIWRAHKGKNPDGPIEVPLPVSIDAEAAVQKLLDLKGQLDAPAVDAFVDLAERKLRPEKLGHRLDVYGTLARLDAALRLGQDKVEAVVETVQPRLLASALGNVRFDQVLGYFETRYSQGGKYKERTYNLRLAASKLDGAVVMPGEVFDFNGVVGPRDEANGYRVAPVIAQGELVDGLGGGTCQISGTLHGAAFFAGMEITERYPHSRPSYYIKLGLDATVVYPTINFRFKNPFDFPVVLHQTVQNGVVRAEILGPERKLTVTYFRRIDEVLPFEQVERQSDKLPHGTRRLAQRGIPGFKTTSSRVVRDGAYAVRQKWKDTYPPTTEIITVGTGPEELEANIADDAHPEYVVDEYLVVTQGPDIRTPGAGGPEPGGGTIESREPGRTGEYGWTEKAGLATYKTETGDESTKVNDVAPAEGEASGVKATSRAEERDKDAAEEARGEARAKKGDEGEQPKKKKKKRKKKKAEE
jgi:vancomycin resistance protein YoaR